MRTILVLAVCLLAGCYRSHLRPEDEAAFDGTRRDGSTHGDGSTRRDGAGEDDEAGARDGSAIGRRDGSGGDGPDAGPALPAEPDPDLGPDARPSDYPEADDWDDLPPASSTDPCCTMDEPILVTSRARDDERLEHQTPLISWGPGFWGLLVTRVARMPSDEAEPHPVIYPLTADGNRLGEEIELDGTTARGRAIRWAEGRWAVAIDTTTHDGALSLGTTTRLYDRDFRAATDWRDVLSPFPLVSFFALARVTRGDRWLALGHDNDEALVITPFGDDDVDSTVERRLFPRGPTYDAIGMRSRAAVLIGGFASGAGGNVLTVLGAPPSLEVLGQVRLPGDLAVQAALAAVRDVVVAVVVRFGEVVADVVDPFAITQVGTSQTLATLSGRLDGYFAVDAVGSSKLGMVGACYGEGFVPEGGMGTSTIDFRVLGADGELRGAPVRVVEDSFRGNIPNCAVGTDDDGFLVAWFEGNALWVRRIHVRR